MMNEENRGSLSSYVEFLSNKDNSHNCDYCPYNIEMSSWPGNSLPCGQFNCWVDLHHNEED